MVAPTKLNPIPQAVDLKSGQIHVWSVRVDAQGIDLDYLHRIVSAEEKAVASGFRREPDRVRYVASHGILRLLIGSYEGTDAQHVTFQTTRHGKPRLSVDLESSLCFNISDSGSWAYFGFCRDGEIGIDVEQVKEISDAYAVARSNFTPEERAALGEAQTPDHLDAFYRIWVRKESIIKADGRGLDIPLKSFSVLSNRVLFPSEGGLKRWEVDDLPAPEGYAAALAHNLRSPDILFREFNPS